MTTLVDNLASERMQSSTFAAAFSVGAMVGAAIIAALVLLV
jgi:hypothetical protein